MQVPDDKYQRITDSKMDEDRNRMKGQYDLCKDFMLKVALGKISTGVKRFLDAGCGEGQFAGLLAGVFSQASGIGIDKDPKSVAVAQETIGQNERMAFAAGNLDESIPEGPFDLILASAVMPFMTNPEQTLKMMFENLAPNGHIWIRDLNVESMVNAIPSPAYQRMANERYGVLQAIGANIYFNTQAVGLLEKAGFTDIQVFDETYPIDDTEVGQLAANVLLKGVYAVRNGVIKMKGQSDPTINEEQYKVWYDEAIAEINRIREQGIKASSVTYPHFIARKP